MDKKGKKGGPFRDWFDKFEKAKAVWESFHEEEKKAKLDRERRIRVEELYSRFHTVGNVRLPFPSLFALKWLDERFGDFDGIDLSKSAHLAAVIWILENQAAVDEVHAMGKAEIEAAIDRQAAEIPASLHLNYVAAVQDIFTVIKKNYLHHQRQILEEAKALLDSDSTPPGA